METAFCVANLENANRDIYESRAPALAECLTMPTDEISGGWRHGDGRAAQIWTENLEDGKMGAKE